jgi:hypothetical protein
MTFQQVFDLWSALSFEDIRDKAILDSSPQIIDSQAEQMSLGQSSIDNVFIGQYQSPEYAAMKVSIGSIAPYGQVDLKLTGDFQHGLELINGTDSIMVQSSDSKNDELIGRYGDEIFGLNSRRLSDVSHDYIKPTFQEELRAAVKL